MATIKATNMKIVIFGPQGSGKGTQADILAEKLSIPHITMGDLLRLEVQSGSKLGKKIECFVNEGDLVPDEITLDLLRLRLDQSDSRNGFIIDGYPRNLNQAKLLEGLTKIDLALEIWISDEESVKRITGRRPCPVCGAVYHLEFNPPKQAGACDKCGGKLIIREDDREDVIKNRLCIYHQQTEPLIDCYKRQGVHLKIDGMPLIAEVAKDIFAKLNLN